MTVSANSNFDPTVDQIIRTGLQHAGLLGLGRNPPADQLAHARDILDATLKSLRGVKLTQLERATLPLVAGTAAYDLPADTVGCDFPMSVVTAGSTSETQVNRMVWAQYQEINNKADTGTPIRCYEERLATVTLRFWPVPTQAYTLNYRRERLIRNAEAGTTLDLMPNWIKGLEYAMAHDMALGGSLPLDRVKYLGELADKLLDRAQAEEQEGGDWQFILGGNP